jgi:integrase
MSNQHQSAAKKPKKLTQSFLETLPSKDERYEVAIERGLFLEVHPSGQKTLRYRYRHGGRREKVTLGPFATGAQPGLTLQQGRIKHAEAQKILLSGKSPAREAKADRDGRKTAVAMGTFAEVAEQWLVMDHKPANKNPGQDETYLSRDILPKIGAMPLTDINVSDVWRCLEPPRKRKHFQAALRVRNVVKRVFVFAIRNNFKGHNPADGIKPKSVAPSSLRDRVLSFDEIPRWLDELYTSSMSQMMKLACHSLLLVPARKTEWLHAPWSDFDLGVGTWVIPSGRSKTGVAITHKLPHQQLALLQQLKELGGNSKWLFPSNRGWGKKPVSKSCINVAIRSLSETPPTFVPHDLRRSVRTGMSKLGISREVAEKCLNHNKQDPYDHDDLYEPRGEALQKWADHIDKLRTDYALKKLGCPRSAQTVDSR